MYGFNAPANDYSWTVCLATFYRSVMTVFIPCGILLEDHIIDFAAVSGPLLSESQLSIKNCFVESKTTTPVAKELVRC